MKTYYHLILFIHENSSPPDSIHLWKFIIAWFYLFMKLVYFLFIHESILLTHFTSFMQSSCILTYIFRTFSWLQNTHIRSNQNKIFKNRVFVKILQIRYLIIFILETQPYEFFLQNMITLFFSLRNWSYNLLLLWKEKSFTWEKEFYLVILLFGIRNSNSLNIAIWNMKLISPWISLIITNYLNIVKHSISPESSWTCRMNLAEHIAWI